MSMSHVDDGTLHAYLDGELSPAEAQGIDAHCAQCPACRARFAEERALIARAGELLALAAPPDRVVPPFPAGDVTPPQPLWWRVRLPLAWAATVLLALGIGMYLGSESSGFRASASSSTGYLAAKDERSQRRAAPEAVAPLNRERARDETRVAKRAAAPPPAAPSAAPQSLRDAGAAGAQPTLGTVPAAFSLDSARRALGHDPVVLPGVPIRDIRRDRIPGYGVAVVIEHQLDSGAVIRLVEGRRTAVQLDRVSVASAGQARSEGDSAGQAELRSAAPAAKMAARTGMVEAPSRLLRVIDQLEVQISGPLPADSLQKLLQLVQPVKP